MDQYLDLDLTIQVQQSGRQWSSLLFYNKLNMSSYKQINNAMDIKHYHHTSHS